MSIFGDVEGKVKELINEFISLVQESLDELKKILPQLEKVFDYIKQIPRLLYELPNVIMRTFVKELDSDYDKVTGFAEKSLKLIEDDIENAEKYAQQAINMVDFGHMLSVTNSLQYMFGSLDDGNPGANGIDQIPVIINDVKELWDAMINKVEECVPKLPAEFLEGPKTFIDDAFITARIAAHTITEDLPPQVKSFVPIRLSPVHQEISKLVHKIENIDTHNFKEEWNTVFPLFLYVLELIEMILDKLGKAIPLGIDLAVSGGIIVESEVGCSTIKLGEAFFSLVLGTGLGVTHKTLSLVDTYVQNFAE